MVNRNTMSYFFQKKKIQELVKYLFLGIFFVVFSFNQHTSLLHAAVETIPIGGEAWNQYLGWLVNQGTSKDNVTPYGIYKEENSADPSKKWRVLGKVWSNYGWICWGESCKNTNLIVSPYVPNPPPLPFIPNISDLLKVEAYFGSDTPPDGTLEAYIDEGSTPIKIKRFLPIEFNDAAGARREVVIENAYPVYGWAKILNTKLGTQGTGWIKLNGSITSANVQDLEDFSAKVDCRPTSTIASDVREKKCKYFVYYDKDREEFGGWAWNQVVGWIAFSGKTLYETPYEKGTVKQLACGLDPQCSQFSYNKNTDSNQFLTQYLGRWVQVLGGSAYAKKGFGGKTTGPTGSNAPISYLLTTGKDAGSTNGAGYGLWKNVCSTDACRNFGTKKSSTGDASSTGIYDVGTPQQVLSGGSVKELRSKLGSLDVSALMPPTTGGNGKNKSGHFVKTITNQNDLFTALTTRATNPDPKINGTIYYYNGDLDIGAPPITPPTGSGMNEWVIQSGLSNQSGARTIVVRGNLKIHSRITYNFFSVNSLQQLPSVAWIVLKRDTPSSASSPLLSEITNADWQAGGNIIIDDCIQPRTMAKAGGGGVVPLAGLFFAEGTITTGTGGTQTTKCTKLASEEPVIGTTDFYEAPLRLYGKLVAKKIKFQRTVKGFSNASEAIWDDGRLIINPPPGVEDFVKKLPIW